MNTKENVPPFYTSIVDLPLSNFIEVLVDNNYARLIRSNAYPSKDELMAAWVKITSEYADAMGSHEHQLWLNLFKECGILEITLTQINTLVEVLQTVYYEPFCSKLNKLLFTNYRFDPANQPEYQKNLKACLNRSKSFKIDLELKRLHMGSIQEKAGKQGAPYTRQYFHDVLITVSDHAKYRIDASSITVYEYAERVRRWNRYCSDLQKNRVQ